MPSHGIILMVAKKLNNIADLFIWDKNFDITFAVMYLLRKQINPFILAI